MPAREGPAAERPPGRIRRLLLLDGSGGLVAAAPAVPPREIVARFWPDLHPYRRWIPLTLTAIAVGAATVTVEIWLFGLLVDDVLVPGDLGPLPAIAAAYFGLLVLGSLAAFADDYLSTLLAERFTLDLRTRTFAHLQRLSPDFLQRRRLGDLLARLTGDIRAIEGFMVGALADGLAALLRIALFVTALFLIEWRLALVAIVAAPFLWIATRVFGGWIRDASRERRRRSGSLTAVAEEALSNAQLVSASNREGDELARLRAEGEGALRAKLASARIGGLLTPAVDLAELAGMMAIVVLGSVAVADGSLSLGGLLVFITYLGKLYGPVRDLGSIGETVFEAAAGAERVIELLDRQPAVSERPGARRLGRAQGRVELHGVGFSYPQRQQPALVGIDLRFEPGEVVALTGPSGAGKSTLASLLVRFHDPDRGRVELDGTDLRELTLRSLRENVSLLLQEAPMMRGTVAANIAYARPGASDAEIVAAARAAGAHEFVRALPAGYETDLGERGRALSGGQRRRIAIARALLADAPVLVLDEPTSGLDAAARDALLEPLRTLAAGRTTLIVSHDPALTGIADRRIELAAGQIVAPRQRAPVSAETGNGNRPAAPLPSGFEQLALLSRARTYDVWDAWDAGRACRVVVKVVRPDRGADERSASRLLAEGRLLETLSHPHIVRALETAESPPAVVMESLGGATLARIVDEEAPLSAVEIAHLGLQLASAVAHLHRRARLHLDLKPSNVIAEAGRARLIDLGLAAPPGRLPPQLGTWCYLAPEQVDGERVGAPADVWGLGALLFECVCRFPPFDDPSHERRTGGSRSSTCEEEPGEFPQLRRRARPVESVREVPPALAALIAACLRPDPAERPVLGELAAELEAVADLPLGERRLSRTLAPPTRPRA